MSTLQQQYDSLAAQLAVAETFVAEFKDKIPDGVGSLTHNSFDLQLTWVSEANRLRALQLAGEIFGRAGWVAHLDSGGKHYHWIKDLYGGEFKIWILGAAKLDQPATFPVPPSSFPLQLQDVNIEESDITVEVPDPTPAEPLF